MKNIKAFLPLLTFVGIFLGAGVYYHYQGVAFAFYQIPAPVAVLPAVVLALLLAQGKLEHRFESFIKGMGDANILTMCMIYLLAGAFGYLTKATGAVDAVVNLGLNVFPTTFILPGIFILASVLSLAMGTSMGTISAIGPIALGIGEKTGIPMPILFGALIGGAMFGDNMSVISDTTIAATKTQGAKMSDKLKENFKFALPSALLTILWLTFVKVDATPIPYTEVEWIKIVPYLLVLVLALSGINVFLVLFTGIVAASITGLSLIPEYGVQKLAQGIFDGFKDMQEIFILSLFMGGLGRMMKDAGGIQIIQSSFAKITRSFGGGVKFQKFWTELSLAASVSLSNLAVANNTVSILICGEFFKEISEKENISAKRSASILDIFSCVIQGIIPYGAQILLASQLSKVSPLELMSNVNYCYILGGVTVLFMIVSNVVKEKASNGQVSLKPHP